MANAFKCDRCEEFSEGEPNRIELISHESVSAFSGWTDSKTEALAELCDECNTDLEVITEDFFEAESHD